MSIPAGSHIATPTRSGSDGDGYYLGRFPVAKYQSPRN